MNFGKFGLKQVGQLYQKVAKNGQKTLKSDVSLTAHISTTKKGITNLI
jgi:hypothetical protein